MGNQSSSSCVMQESASPSASLSALLNVLVTPRRAERLLGRVWASRSWRRLPRRTAAQQHSATERWSRFACRTGRALRLSPRRKGSRRTRSRQRDDLPKRRSQAASAQNPLVTADIQYVRNGGVAIAYQVVGDADVDLVYVSDYVSNLVDDCEYPRWRDFYERRGSTTVRPFPLGSRSLNIGGTA